MRTIYKYPLEHHPLDSEGVTRLELPRGARVVKVDTQHGDLFAWVMHEREALSQGPREVVRVTVARTGGDAPPDCGEYLSTFFEHGGLYVWHAFVRYGDLEVAGEPRH